MENNEGIIIYVSVRIGPEIKGRFLTILRDIVLNAREEPGCLKYDWYCNPEDNENFIIHGEFDNETNFRLYKKSEVVEYIQRLLIPLLKEKPRYRHYRARVFEQG